MTGGGLSDAKVLRLRVTDSRGTQIHDAIAKIAPAHQIKSEHQRYDKHVSRLAPQATPRKIVSHEFGAGPLGANFYGVAVGFEADAFKAAIAEESALKIDSVKCVASITKPWVDGVGQNRRSIRDIRRCLLSDELMADLSRIHSLPWATEFEARELQTTWTRGCYEL